MIPKSFFFIFVVQSVGFITLNQLEIIKIPIDVVSKGYSIEGEKHVHRQRHEQYDVFPTQQWLLSKDVSHYSTLMEANNDTLQFTSLAFIRDTMENPEYLLQHLKCVIRNENGQKVIKEPSEIYEINYKPMTVGPRSLWRIKCNLTGNDGVSYASSNTNGIVLALIIDENKVKEETILYKRPSMMRRSVPKLPQVAHCLHKVINLTSSRFKMLSNWIDMQRAIGIHKIKMCMFDSNITQYERQLQEKYADYVEIVKHHTKIEDVCKWQMEKQREHPHSIQYAELLANCREMHDMHFNMSEYAVFQHHQMMCTQSCYAGFRNEYEYVTNYDFDEIILPRRRGYDLDANLDKIESVKSCDDKEKINSILAASKKETQNYKIYDYARDLFTKYGRENAYIKFKQAISIHDPKAFIKLIVHKRPLRKHLKRVNSHLTVNLHRFEHIIEYMATREDHRFFDAFANINTTLHCLRERLNSQQVSSAFKYMLSTDLIVGREGKSILNTDFVEAYDAHNAIILSAGSSKSKIVPYSDGFVTHFRDFIGKYFTHKFSSFSSIKVDLDYFSFLVNLYGH